MEYSRTIRYRRGSGDESKYSAAGCKESPNPECATDRKGENKTGVERYHARVVKKRRHHPKAAGLGGEYEQGGEPPRVLLDPPPETPPEAEVGG